jgi:hypothetical protein
MSKAGEMMLELEVMTDKMVQVLDEATYLDLAEFVDERNRLLTELQTESLTVYKDKIRHILEQDELIRAKMMEFKQEAAEAIRRFQSAEKSKQAYDKEYTIDSVFFNRRK